MHSIQTYRALNQPEQHRRFRSSRLLSALALFLIGASIHGVTASAAFAATDSDASISMRLADLLRSARAVVSRNQDLINNADIGDKGLTGEKVVADSIALFQERTGEDPREIDPASRLGQLIRAQMNAIQEVIDENQSTINATVIGFKGFIPAVFARLVNEKFGEVAGEKARFKVTAPENLVRNRKARPDAWETAVIADHFLSADWPKGKPFSETVDVDGKPAFRILVPEYYAPSCLACHGEPAGEVDITGYPKEGGKEGELGAAISIILFK
jgi:hypothetical protein